MSEKKNIKEMFDLSGRVVIITGAAGLLGPEYAEVLSEAGANVVLADVKKDRCDELARELKVKFKTDPMSVGADVSNRESIEKMVEEVVSKYSRIDALINNAVYNPLSRDAHAPFEDYSIENWNKILSVNLTGVFLCSQAVGRQMVKQGYGNIINISSTYGLVGADQRIYGDSGINSSIAYAATKSAVLNMTRYLASYWEGKNIRVNTLSPGGVFNDQDEEFVKRYSSRTTLGRMANRWDYRGAILFLVSDASEYMTGANLVVDGGWTAW